MDKKQHKEVILNQQNEWVSTSWEVRQSDVPEVVMNALKASGYKTYRIDDVDFYETPAGSHYQFELDHNPNDIYLLITPEGKITKK